MRAVRHSLCALAAVAAALAAMAPAAAAQGGAAVEVVPVSGPSAVVELATLTGREDVVQHAYAVRSQEGETTSTIAGFSLSALLAEAGVDVFTFSYLEIPRPGGGAVLLSNEDARRSPSAAGGPPVVWAEQGGTGFLRPSAGADDLNAPDTFTAAPLVIRLRTGQLIDVQAQASTIRTEPGEPVTFAAEVVQSGAGQELEFSWSFDDGKTASGAEVTHAFREPGTYDVVVGATTPGDGTGGDDVVTVQVGEPKKQGPDRRGGGDNEEEDAPDSGQSSGASGPASPGGAAHTGGGDVPSPSADTNPGAAPTDPAPPDRAPEREQPSRGSKPPADDGVEVVGELLSATTERPLEAEADAGREPDAVAARTGAPADESPSALAGVIAGVLGVGGLVGLGALRELERLRLPQLGIGGR